MRRHAGFTIIELMITVAIVSILLVVGVPSMTRFLADRAAEANAQEFIEAVRFARTEAMKRAQPIKLCATDAPEAEAPVCKGDDWSKGWLVVHSGSSQVLRIQNGLQAMRATDPVDAAAGEIEFQSTGIAFGGDGTYDFYPTGDDKAADYKSRVRRVTVSKVGRALLTKGI